jgi:histidinol-phosphatase (PHP family)
MIHTDLHVHPTPWKFGHNTYRTFAEAAYTRGVDVLGFAEHGPPCDPDPRYRGLEEGEMESYFRSVETVKQEFSEKLQIFCGLEMDFQPGLLEQLRNLREQYPFDYCLASVHIIDDWHLDTPGSLSLSQHRNKSEEELYRLYYSRIEEAAQSGLFEGFAHLDYIRRSLPHSSGNPPDYALTIFEGVAAQITARGLTVEINTRGLTVDSMREVYPTLPFLRILARAGVSITAGSDAHEANRIGEGFGAVRQALWDIGLSESTYFIKGKPLKAGL